MRNILLTLLILGVILLTTGQAVALYEPEIKLGYHSLYYDIYSTANGVEAVKLGVDYQLNPSFSIVGNYTLVPQKHFLSLNAKFKGFELENHDAIFSFLSGYRFSKEGGNFRFGPLFSRELNDSLTLVGGGFLLVHLPEPSNEEELPDLLYQLGVQYQLFRNQFGFDQINVELKLSNMVAPEDRGSGFSLGLRSYW